MYELSQRPCHITYGAEKAAKWCPCQVWWYLPHLPSHTTGKCWKSAFKWCPYHIWCHISHLLVAQLESAEKCFQMMPISYLLSHVTLTSCTAGKCWKNAFRWCPYHICCHMSHCPVTYMRKSFFIEIHQIPAGFQWIPVCSTRNFWYPTGICGAVWHSAEEAENDQYLEDSDTDESNWAWMIEIWRVGKTSRPQTVAVIQILPVNETLSLMTISVTSMTRLLAFISLIFICL